MLPLLAPRSVYSLLAAVLHSGTTKQQSVVVHTIHLHGTHHICKSRTISLALGLLLFACCRTWFSFREWKKKLTALNALSKWHAKPASRESVSPFPGADFGMRFIVDHSRRPCQLSSLEGSRCSVKLWFWFLLAGGCATALCQAPVPVHKPFLLLVPSCATH
jgi:hypothetical protein